MQHGEGSSVAERAPVERDVAGSNPVPRPEIITKAQFLVWPYLEWLGFVTLQSPIRERPQGVFLLLANDAGYGVHPGVNISID